jgi:DNA-directed RNA polymerase specialized sigma24 family protein
MQYDLKMPDADVPDANRDLIAPLRAGDREAFTLIYQAHSSAVFRLALHMSGDAMKATEMTQDVFVWLIHHRPFAR